MQSFGTEKAITFRQPATANLMIDSADRDEDVYSSPWDFQIVKRQSVQNGFMTRLGTTEVVLEWCEPNISSSFGNNTIVVDICGTGLALNQTITFPDGFYTVADVLNYFARALTDLSGTTGTVFTVQQFSNSQVAILPTPDTHEIKITEDTPLSLKLGFAAGVYLPELDVYECADLRLYRYIDFTSAQLTYCQDLKDNTTANIERDVLCRWYMAYDNQNNLDEYGFPILMGYEKFVIRRLFNPPKQIKWDTNLPLGNLIFNVYDDQGTQLKDLSPGGQGQTSEWLMTLQLSEN
jgi:hypothetical protein